MGYTFEQLHKLNVAQLREIAQGIDHEALHGYSTMHKDKLLPVLVKVLGIEVPHHHAVGAEKTKLKAQIRLLKKQRDDAIGKHDKKGLKEIRRQIHNLKNELRKHMV